jgi:RNA polymerase sigma-70 factor (ECF subfamily)
MQEQFLKYITTHKALIYKVCHTFEPDTERQRDLFQDIILNLWKAFPNFKAQSKWTTWAYRIALNVAITQRRKPQISTSELDEGVYEHLSDSVFDESKEIRLNALYKAINHLNEVEKALILLYLDDVSYSEIAEIIGITENNIGVKLNRIKSKLKLLLANYEQ